MYLRFHGMETIFDTLFRVVWNPGNYNLVIFITIIPKSGLNIFLPGPHHFVPGTWLHIKVSSSSVMNCAKYTFRPSITLSPSTPLFIVSRNARGDVKRQAYRMYFSKRWSKQTDPHISPRRN